MNEKQNTGRQLESLDHVNAAIELLDECGLNYILYVGAYEKGTLIQSGLDDDFAAMLKSWLDSGELNKITLEHLKRFFPDI